MAESKTTGRKTVARKPAAKKPVAQTAPKENPNALIKMIRDDGKTADVHPSMVDDYKTGGYREA